MKLINKQLETNVNNELMLAKLAENLNLDFITDGSNIKKIADTYSNEHTQFANVVDQTIATGYVSTMPSEYLDLFGRQYNLHRRRYNNIVILSNTEAVSVKINKDQALVTALDGPTQVLSANTVIYSNDNFMVTNIDNVYFNTINDTVNLSVRLTLSSEASYFVIKEETEFTIASNNSIVSTILPYLDLTFNRSIGLASIEETEDDYKARIYEGTYVAHNGANSLISSITKEVPLLHSIEVDNYLEGRPITYIYPYTKRLILSGNDNLIETFIGPMIETSLSNKVIYGQLVKVIPPHPVVCNLFISFNTDTRPTVSYLDNICLNLNDYFYTDKLITKQTLFTYINNYLTDYKLKQEDYRFEFTSPHISEEVFNLANEGEDVVLPKGRFLFLNSIQEEV